MTARPLWAACKKGDLVLVNRLLEDGSPVSDGFLFPLQAAADWGHLAVVDRLLQDPRVDPSRHRNSAIQGATMNGHYSVVSRLMQDSRVDPSDRDNRAVKWAAQYRVSRGIVQRLLDDPPRGFYGCFQCHSVLLSRDIPVSRAFYRNLHRTPRPQPPGLDHRQDSQGMQAVVDTEAAPEVEAGVCRQALSRQRMNKSERRLVYKAMKLPCVTNLPPSFVHFAVCVDGFGRVYDFWRSSDSRCVVKTGRVCLILPTS